MSDFQQAVDRLTERKHIIAEETGQEGRVGVIEPGGYMLFMGYDLNPEEVLNHALRVMKLGLAALILDEVEVPDAISGAWVDGLLTGMEIGKIREDS